MKKNIIGLVFLLTLILSLAACSSTTTDPIEEATTEVVEEATTEIVDSTVSSELELTLEELAAYNGENGQRAYVAVHDIIYDVTDLKAWKDGKHNGFQAGADLTDAIENQSPHGVDNLKAAVIVGKLVVK